MRTSMTTLGTVHVHLDVGRQHDALLEMLASGIAGARPVRVNRISHATVGRERAGKEVTYDAHTPPGAFPDAGREFAAFATILTEGRDDAVELLRALIPECVRREIDLVIEAEQVIAKGAADAWTALPPSAFVARIDGREVPVPPLACDPVELHHALDLSAGGFPSLETIAAAAEDHGVIVGGWFQYDRDGTVAIRSNGFDQLGTFLERARREQRALRSLPLVADATVRTTCEHVLGVWRIRRDGDE